MNNEQIFKLNRFISEAYECHTFSEFLLYAIRKLHQIVMYDSGMFYCAISRDCSFFKPYLTGPIEQYYEKKPFLERDSYVQENDEGNRGKEAYVYKAADLKQGIVRIDQEPRNQFLVSQTDLSCCLYAHHL